MVVAPTLALIPVASIDPAPNVRSQVGDVDGLAATITEHGILQPVRVRPVAGGRFQLVVGQRRVAAAAIAGEALVPAVVDNSEPDPDRDRIAQLIENVARQDLNPMDLARALRAALDADPTLTQKALAHRLGFTGAWLTNIIVLLKAPPEVQALAEQGRVTAQAVRRVSTLPPERQVELMRAHADGGLTYEALDRATSAAHAGSGNGWGTRPGRRQTATFHRVLIGVDQQLGGLTDMRKPPADTAVVETLDSIRRKLDVLQERVAGATRPEASGVHRVLASAPISTPTTPAAAVDDLATATLRLLDLTQATILPPRSLAALDQAIAELQRVRQRCTPPSFEVRRSGPVPA